LASSLSSFFLTTLIAVKQPTPLRFLAYLLLLFYFFYFLLVKSWGGIGRVMAAALTTAAATNVIAKKNYFNISFISYKTFA